MTVYLGSRYQDQPFFTVEDSLGIVRQFVMRAVTPPRDIAALPTYIWKDSDRIDRVARDLLGSPSNWHLIMDVNPEIADPGGITPGTVVRIPSNV